MNYRQCPCGARHYRDSLLCLECLNRHMDAVKPVNPLQNAMDGGNIGHAKAMQAPKKKKTYENHR